MENRLNFNIMKEEVVNILLNGMSVPYFLAMYLAAWLGVLLFFLGHLLSAIKHNPETPGKFDWPTFWKMSGLRFVIGGVAMAFAIIYFKDFSKLLFNIDTGLQVNGMVAFFIGLSIDNIVSGVLGYKGIFKKK